MQTHRQSINVHFTEKSSEPNDPVKPSEPDSQPLERKKFLTVQHSARIIAQLILEILSGKRPLHHIKPWIDPTRYAILSQKIDTILKLRQNASRATANYVPSIRILRILPISSNVFEISVVAYSNSRFRALALRLEGKTLSAHKISENTLSVWATAIELG